MKKFLALATILSVSAMAEEAMFTHDPKPQSITFNFDSDVFVEIKADGEVIVKGDLDEATMLFWKHITQMFPDFKERICKNRKE